MSKKLTLDFISLRTKNARIETLTKLNLWGNDFEDVSILKDLQNLEVISLSVNKISSLEVFSKLPKLKELYLRKNCVLNFEEIKHWQKCKTLKILSLMENPISTEDDYRKRLIEMLPQLLKLDDWAIDSKEIGSKEKDQSKSWDKDVNRVNDNNKEKDRLKWQEDVEKIIPWRDNPETKTGWQTQKSFDSLNSAHINNINNPFANNIQNELNYNNQNISVIEEESSEYNKYRNNYDVNIREGGNQIRKKPKTNNLVNKSKPQVEPNNQYKMPYSERARNDDKPISQSMFLNGNNQGGDNKRNMMSNYQTEDYKRQYRKKVISDCFNKKPKVNTLAQSQIYSLSNKTKNRYDNQSNEEDEVLCDNECKDEQGIMRIEDINSYDVQPKKERNKKNDKNSKIKESIKVLLPVLERFDLWEWRSEINSWWN